MVQRVKRFVNNFYVRYNIVMFWQIVIIESIAVTVIGALSHFVYNFSGRNKFVAFFAAVNESTWEHVKLALTGLFVCTLADIWFLGSNPNYWLARSLSFVVPVIVIPALFYGYCKLLKSKKALLPFDIVIFAVASVLASLAFAGVLQLPTVGMIGGVISVIIGVVVLAAYLLLTRFPLKNNFLFKDPVTGKYGMDARVGRKKEVSPQRLVILGAGALILGGGVALAYGLTAQSTENGATGVAVEQESEAETETIGELEIPEGISEKERELARNYHVAEYLPRLLSIPRLGIYGRVTVVGKENGAVGSPSDYRMMAWYDRSSLPGMSGASLIDGHGGDYYGNEIFNELVDAQVGDEIFIEMGDEKTRYVYKIVEVLWKKAGTEANNYMSTALRPVASGEPTLTLITCAGSWSNSIGTFTHRIFVRAVLVQ